MGIQQKRILGARGDQPSLHRSMAGILLDASGDVAMASIPIWLEPIAEFKHAEWQWLGSGGAEHDVVELIDQPSLITDRHGDLPPWN